MIIVFERREREKKSFEWEWGDVESGKVGLGLLENKLKRGAQKKGWVDRRGR